MFTSIPQFLPATAIGSERKDEGNYLVFYRIGGSYFLRKVQQGILQGSLRRSRSEKEATMASDATASDVTTETVKIAAVK